MEMIKCENCKKEIFLNTTVCDCGEPNAHYAQDKSDSIKEQGEIKKLRKCKKGHLLTPDKYQYTEHCPELNCGARLNAEVFSLCRGCGNEVSDEDELCERCNPGSKCGAELDDKKSPESQRALRPRLECQSSELFKPEIKNGYVIGREGNINTTFLNNIAISRKHASFIEENGNWFIRDEGSKFGTKVDWEPITPHEKVPLKNKAVICLAEEIVFVFKME